jgi:acyl-CoA synthetase (AMP-forming)/AMP-acid ligase II
MSVLSTILAYADSSPDKVAVFEKETPKTYEQLVQDIQSAAHQLRDRDVQAGDCVLIYAVNNYAFICTYFAVHLVGATVVNISTDADDAYRQFIIDRTQPRLCIEDCATFLHDSECEKTFSTAEIKEADIADLMFTSGATGEPKGVVLTHRQLVAATEHIIGQVQNTSADVELLLMPLSHSFGMGRMRTTLYVGGTLVLGYPLQRLKGVFKALEVHKVTGLGLVPSAWTFIVQMSKNMIARFAPQLNYIEFGSAHLPSEDKKLLTVWFPQTRIVMHYGLTEVSRAVFTHLHTDNHDSAGNLSRGAEVAIIRKNGELAPPGEEGEIALKAPWMMSEYYQNPDLTSEAFVDGYLRTGDLGKVEGDSLFLTGRLKEIINVGGKKVSPYQVEDVLNNSEIVNESACIALPDKDMGEVVQAFVVLEAAPSLESHEATERLKEIAAQHLPVHMRPHLYNYVASLPKTASGKIQRLKLVSG